MHLYYKDEAVTAVYGNKAKVNFAVEQVMKAQRRSRVIALLFL